jgi:hypothetical protein
MPQRIRPRFAKFHRAIQNTGMGFETRGEAVIGAHDLAELRLVYRVLHEGLARHPDLMDTEFLVSLQNHLHERAKADGVDVSDHGAWDRWLGHANAPDCAARVARRQMWDPGSGGAARKDGDES